MDAGTRADLTLAQAKGVLPGEIPIRQAKARHCATVRVQTEVRRVCGLLPTRDKCAATALPHCEVRGRARPGEPITRWSCLRFSYSNPIRYRYAYRVGSGYLGPRSGPTGFEVSAEGDLDGDGKTSLFTVIGQEDPVAKSIVLSKTFVTDEYE